MKKLRICFWLLVIAAIVLPNVLTTRAQEPEINLESCRSELTGKFATLQREYRSVLFGQTAATGTTVGSVRYAADGSSWYKADDDEWRSLNEGYEGTEWSDDQMENQAEFAARRGIFAAKRTLTSEIIPHLTQSVRALQCKVESVCDVLKQSFQQSQEGSQSVTVKVPGCIEVTEQTFPSCHFVQGGEIVASEAQLRSYCATVGKHLLESEANTLKLAVEYDSSYRSLLQFAGSFDLFLQELRWPLTNTVRRAAALVGQFNRIPCFMASCTDSPAE